MVKQYRTMPIKPFSWLVYTITPYGWYIRDFSMTRFPDMARRAAAPGPPGTPGPRLPSALGKSWTNCHPILLRSYRKGPPVTLVYIGLEPRLFILTCIHAHMHTSIHTYHNKTYHNITLHYLTCNKYKPIQPLHIITQHYTPLHNITHHYTTLHTIRQHYTPVDTITYHFRPFQTITIPLHTITHHYTPLNTITPLHAITRHYIPLHTITHH